MSPIIATILLVAITVVLAAVLYILISGLTKGPGNTPIGTAFGAGTPTLSQGAVAATFPPCKAADYCYAISVGQASGGLTVGSINMQITTTSGTVYALPSAGGAAVTDIAGKIVVSAAVAVGAFSVTTWAAGAGYTTTTPLTTSMTIWLDLGTANPTGLGLSLVVLGTGSYSGQVTVALP